MVYHLSIMGVNNLNVHHIPVAIDVATSDEAVGMAVRLGKKLYGDDWRIDVVLNEPFYKDGFVVTRDNFDSVYFKTPLNFNATK